MRRELRLAGMRLLGLSVCKVLVLNVVSLTCRCADAFIRDELSKGRYDPAIAGICFDMLMEVFDRVLKTDLGPRDGREQKVEDIC